MELKRGLEEIFTPEFESFLAQGALTLRYQKDNIWHSRPSPYHCSEGQEGPSKKLKLHDVLKEELCEECAYGDYNVFIESKEYRWVEKIVSLRRELNICSEVTPDTPALTRQQWIRDVKELEDQIEVMRRQLPEGSDFFDALELQRKRTLTKLESITISSKSKAALEKRILSCTVPPGMKPELFDIDSSMSLIGIYPSENLIAGTGGTNDAIGAVIEAYSIRKDSAIVLYAPAYFHTYLTGRLQSSSETRRLILITEAPTDPEGRENASYLWSPQSNGVLASLKKAVISGQALSG